MGLLGGGCTVLELALWKVLVEIDAPRVWRLWLCDQLCNNWRNFVAWWRCGSMNLPRSLNY